MRAPWCEISTDLYVSGMAERIRWVPAPENWLFVEIGRGFNFWGYLKNITTHLHFQDFQKILISRSGDALGPPDGADPSVSTYDSVSGRVKK